jgi:hypothetical protein
MNASSSLGRDARLAGLAGDVDLDRISKPGRAWAVALELAQRGVGGDRVDQPTCGTICLTLRDWSAPMKCQRSRPSARPDLLE